MAVQNDPKPNKGRKKGKIALGVVLILILALAGIAIWQKNNIEAVKQFTQYSQEELEQQLQDNDQQVDALLQAALEAARQVDAEGAQSAGTEGETEGKPEAGPEAETAPDTEGETPEVTPTAPSKPEEQAPASVPEAPKAEQPQSKPAESQPQPQTPTAQPPAEKAPEPQKPVPSGPTYEQQLKAISDKVYALRAQYLKALDDLQAEATAAYKAMPKSQRTKKAIASFVSTYISKATNLEKTCDGQMDDLVSELTRLQKKYGQSMDLVDSVKYTYANEKSLKKAWYMSELQKRGLI